MKGEFWGVRLNSNIPFASLDKSGSSASILPTAVPACRFSAMLYKQLPICAHLVSKNGDSLTSVTTIL